SFRAEKRTANHLNALSSNSAVPHNTPAIQSAAAMDLRQKGEARMHTIEKLERLKDVAERAGYTIRQEWLGGVAGGACQFAGRKWIFIDLSLSVIEQLDQVAAAL